MSGIPLVGGGGIPKGGSGVKGGHQEDMSAGRALRWPQAMGGFSSSPPSLEFRSHCPPRSRGCPPGHSLDIVMCGDHLDGPHEGTQLWLLRKLGRWGGQVPSPTHPSVSKPRLICKFPRFLNLPPTLVEQLPPSRVPPCPRRPGANFR